MIEYLLNNGFWFYRDCGCAIPGKIYKNHAGLEVKVTRQTEEFVISRNGQNLEHGITTHYTEKLKKYL